MVGADKIFFFTLVYIFTLEMKASKKEAKTSKNDTKPSKSAPKETSKDPPKPPKETQVPESVASSSKGGRQ